MQDRHLSIQHLFHKLGFDFEALYQDQIAFCCSDVYMIVFQRHNQLFLRCHGVCEGPNVSQDLTV